MIEPKLKGVGLRKNNYATTLAEYNSKLKKKTSVFRLDKDKQSN